MSSLTPGNPGDPGSTTDFPHDPTPFDDNRAPIPEAPIVATMAHAGVVQPPAGAARTRTPPGRVALVVLNFALLVACGALTALNTLYPARQSHSAPAPATRSTVTSAPGSSTDSTGGFALPSTPTPTLALAPTVTRTPAGPVATPTSAVLTPTPTPTPTPAATANPDPTPCFTCG
jgi:hypothetical protein